MDERLEIEDVADAISVILRIAAKTMGVRFGLLAVEVFRRILTDAVLKDIP